MPQTAGIPTTTPQGQEAIITVLQTQQGAETIHLLQQGQEITTPLQEAVHLQGHTHQALQGAQADLAVAGLAAAEEDPAVAEEEEDNHITKSHVIFTSKTTWDF